MDEKSLEDSVHRGIDFVEAHKKEFSIAIVLLLVGVALGISLHFMMKSKANLAMRAFYEIQELEREAVGGNIALKDSPGMPKVKQAYIKAIEDFGNNASGKILIYHYAGFLADTEDYAGALQYYKRFVKGYHGPSPYRALVLLNMAFCADKLGNTDQAKLYLSEANAIEENPQKDFILYRFGVIEEKLGNIKAAQEHYANLLKDFAGSPLAVRARERQVDLQNQSQQAHLLNSSSSNSLGE